MRRAARTDRNHREIIEALRAAGAAVTDTSAVGGGFPDLTVSYRRAWYLIEVKDGQKSPSRRKLTGDQQTWHGQQHATVHVVLTAHEALVAIGAVTPAGDRWVLDNIS